MTQALGGLTPAMSLLGYGLIQGGAQLDGRKEMTVGDMLNGEVLLEGPKYGGGYKAAE